MRDRVFDENGRPAGPAYRERLADLKTASVQVGDSDRARLAWVVTFAREDPRAWHSSAVAQFGDGLLALEHPFPESLCGGVRLPPRIPAAEVREIHEKIASLLQRLVTARVMEYVEIPTQGLTIFMVRITAVGAKNAVFAQALSAKRLDVLLLNRIRDLLFRAGGRVIACGLCGRPIFAVRKQMYCDSNTCGQKARNVRKATRRELASKGKRR